MRFFNLALLVLAVVVLASLAGEILWGDEIIWGTLGSGGDQIIWGD